MNVEISVQPAYEPSAKFELGCYRPTIRVNDIVVWQGFSTVPLEHGDYDNDQEKLAARIAEDHLASCLDALLNDELA